MAVSADGVRAYGTRRIRRRRVLTGTMLGAASIGGLVACGKSSAPARPSSQSGAGVSGSSAASRSASPAAQQPRRGGTLSHAGGNEGSYDTAGVSFDPHTYLSIAAESYRLFYQGLLAYDARTYAVQPELAQKWEQPSQTQYLFHLQPGVKWQNKAPANGRAMTMDDVIYSLNRARTDDPRFFSRSILANVDKIEAADPATLRVTTKQPDAATLNKFSADNLMLLAPEVVEKADKFATAETAVGTGAFILRSSSQGSSAEYVRNPDYWKPGLPYLDGIRNIDLKDEEAGYAAFLSGQVDVARLNGPRAKEFVAKQGAGYNPDWFLDNTSIQLMPNSKAKPMDDPRVTRALRLLINHDEMKTAWAEQWFGRGKYASILATALEAWDLSEAEYAKYPEWKQPKDDAVKEALSLLSAAGYSKDNALKFEVITLTTPFVQAASELAQAQWRQLGQGVVNAQLTPKDLPTANQIRSTRQFVFLVHGNNPSITEPGAWLNEIYRSGASNNFTNFSDPKVDDLIDRQQTTFDVQQRKSLVRDIIVYMIDHAPSVIPSNRYFFDATAAKLRGYAPEFYINGNQYEHIWLSA